MRKTLNSSSTIFNKSAQVNSIFLPQSNNDNNPYQKKLASELRNLGVNVDGLSYRIFFLGDILRSPKPTILHLHWLHSFLIRTTLFKSLLSSTFFVMQLLILKLLGVKIVWTVHNLKNHDNGYLNLERFYTSLVGKLCNSIIIHGDSVKENVRAAVGLKNSQKLHVIPHANYIDCYQNDLSRQQARTNLSLNQTEPIFLFLGLIRPYKGVPELIDAFETIDNENAKLLIVGKIWGEDPDFENLITQKIAKNSQITLIPKFVPDDELQLYFNASDVVVFPYKDILTSGAVLLAMSFGKACIAPRLGCIKDTLDDKGSFLYEPNSADGLSNSIQLAIAKQTNLSKMGQHNFSLAQNYGWDRIAKMTSKVYSDG